MKRNKGLIWGIVLIVLGVVIALKKLNVIDFDLFFDGWWTLFIIVPSLIGLFNDNDKVGSIVGLLIGVLLLLNAQDIIDFSNIWTFFLPALLIIIGLSIIIKNTGKKIPKSKNNDEIISAFSSQKVNKEGETFEGANIDAVFGGVDLDLRSAKIKDDSVIKASAIFGGVKIIVPDDVNVIVNNTSIFGGVSNKCSKNTNAKITLYIEAVALFGGIEINEYNREDN